MIGIAGAAVLRLLITKSAYTNCKGGATLLGEENSMKSWEVICRISHDVLMIGFPGFNHGIFYHISIGDSDTLSRLRYEIKNWFGFSINRFYRNW